MFDGKHFKPRPIKKVKNRKIGKKGSKKSVSSADEDTQEGSSLDGEGICGEGKKQKDRSLGDEMGDSLYPPSKYNTRQSHKRKSTL